MKHNQFIVVRDSNAAKYETKQWKSILIVYKMNKIESDYLYFLSILVNACDINQLSFLAECLAGFKNYLKLKEKEFCFCTE